MNRAARLPRSYLYVPGNAPEKMTKAYSSIADAMVLDLEDAVPMPAKDTARANVRRWLDAVGDDKETWVRINSGPTGLVDIASLAGAGTISGLVLAKASVENLASVGAELDRLGLNWLLSPLLETPQAVFDVREIAASARVRRLQLGEYDLCAEAGITPGEDESETQWARSRVVMASAEAGLDPPVAPVSAKVRDTEAFAQSTRRAARQGFHGRACIHPTQLSIVHELFSPSADEVLAAKEMIALFESSHAAGRSVVVDKNGRLVDEATVRSARRTLALMSATGEERAGPSS